MNIRLIKINKIIKIIFCIYGLVEFCIVNGERRWHHLGNIDKEYTTKHTIGNHLKDYSANKDVTISPLNTAILSKYSTITTTTTTSSSSTSTQSTIAAKHRIRHSNNFNNNNNKNNNNNNNSDKKLIINNNRYKKIHHQSKKLIPNNWLRSIGNPSSHLFKTNQINTRKYYSLKTHLNASSSILAAPATTQMTRLNNNNGNNNKKYLLNRDIFDNVRRKSMAHRFRHPYDVLRIPYKDRILPIRKSLDISNYDFLSNNSNEDDEDDEDGEDGEDDEDDYDDEDDDDDINDEVKYKYNNKNRRRSKMLLKSNDNNKYNYNNKRIGYDNKLYQNNNFNNSSSVDSMNNNKNYRKEDIDDISSSSYIPGTLTNHKLETLGTHEAVKKSRHSHMTNNKHQRNLASAHANKIYSEAACKWPKPKIVSVQTDPAKSYVPHCTILHLCGNDAGCCSTDTLTCVERYTQEVDLYFYVSILGSKQNTIEKQTFINHTECHCVDRISSTKLSTSSPTPQPPPPPSDILKHTVASTIISCKCPKEFEKVIQDDNVCRCDCSSGDSGCDWMKKGLEHFSMEDRKCIIENRCNMPTCEYGNYDKRTGKCPNKEDKLALGFSFNLN